MNHDVGSGLEEFVSNERLGEFTGRLRLKFMPESATREQLQKALEDATNVPPIVVALSDLSGSVMALVSEKSREKVHEIVADTKAWDDLSQPNKTFSATLRSVNWKNERFFVLKGLQ